MYYPCVTHHFPGPKKAPHRLPAAPRGATGLRRLAGHWLQRGLRAGAVPLAAEVFAKTAGKYGGFT